MGPRALLVAITASAVIATGSLTNAHAEPPSGGLFIPGKSLAAARLGMTPNEILATWGARHGVCRGCEAKTWYFNEKPFQPQGTGVVFRSGRAVALFTLWKPKGWTTPEKLSLGADGGKIGETYGELESRACDRYTALVLRGAGADSVFYVYRDDLWGFGLVRRGVNPCF
jgi:hypothetical protein